MTIKKMVLGLGLGLCSLLAFSATNSYAENGYCTGVKVIQAGARSTGKFVQLKNTRTDCVGWPQNTARSFFLDNTTGEANGMLAAALAAQSTGATVVIVALVPNTYTNGGKLQYLTSYVP